MNPWKAIALIMIGLLIITAGVRFEYMETHRFTLNEEQKAFVTKAARDGLNDEIEGKNYNVIALDRGEIISTAYGEKKVAFVIFTYGNTTISVLVDVDSGDVVKKSTVEYSGWMTAHKNPERWPHNRLFNRLFGGVT